MVRGTEPVSYTHLPWEKIWTNPQCAAIRAESAKMEHICQLQAGNRKEAEA